MQGILKIWIVLILLALATAALLGNCHPYVSKDTKKRLKELETERGYKCDIAYKGHPVVKITESYNLRKMFRIVYGILVVASVIPIFSSYTNEATAYFLGDNLIVCRLAIFIVSLAGHTAFAMMLYFHTYAVSDMSFLKLKREYERRQAIVEIKYSE